MCWSLSTAQSGLTAHLSTFNLNENNYFYRKCYSTIQDYQNPELISNDENNTGSILGESEMHSSAEILSHPFCFDCLVSCDVKLKNEHNQEFIDNSGTTLVDQKALLEQLLASAGLPPITDSARTLYTNLDQVMLLLPAFFSFTSVANIFYVYLIFLILIIMTINCSIYR